MYYILEVQTRNSLIVQINAILKINKNINFLFYRNFKEFSMGTKWSNMI